MIKPTAADKRHGENDFVASKERFVNIGLDSANRNCCSDNANCYGDNFNFAVTFHIVKIVNITTITILVC